MAATRPTRGAGAQAPLLEREAELAALEAALDRLDEGVGSLILIEGPAGIGKTALLDRGRDVGRDRSLLVRPARAGQLEREVPFGLARQLFEPVVERAVEKERERLLSGSAQLARLALGYEREPGSSPMEGDPFAPIHGLFWLLANLADSSPCLLAIDDIHWADAQSLRWLEHLARRLADLPVLVITCARSGEPGSPPELEPLRAEATQHLRPAPLSPSAVEELIAAELDAIPMREFCEACSSASGGNPFLLAEVLRALRADGIEPTAEAADAIVALAPETLARYVLVRLARFGEDAIALSRAVAVLGGAPQIRHAAMLAGIPEQRARELCDRLRGAEILAPGQPIEFVHPLVRSAIYREMGEEERNVMHRSAAELLESTGSEPRDVAPHLMACAPNGDQWVVEQLRAAAREAASAGAFQSARAYRARALEEPADDQLQVRFELGLAMIESDPDRAPMVLTEVAEAAEDPALRGMATLFAALAHFIAGNLPDAVGSYSRLLDSLPAEAHEQRMQLEAIQFCLKRISMGADAGGLARIQEIVESGNATSRGECLAHQALGVHRFFIAEPVESCLELARVFPPPPGQFRLLVPVVASAVFAWSGRREPARRAIGGFVDSAREAGELISVGSGMACLAEFERLSGRLADAEAQARAALDIVHTARGDTLAERWAKVILVATLVARGELDSAARLATAVDLSAGMSRGSTSPAPMEARAYLRIALGQLESGVADWLAVGEEMERHQLLNPALVPWRQEAAPALAALGRTAEAEELVAVGEERARRFGAPHVIGSVLRARALIEPKARSISTLRESVATLEAGDQPYELARSLLELGAALRRDGQRSQSREPLRRALELAHRSGAGGVERRAREELAAAGSRPRSVVRSGIDALTASELRTAKLAAEGLSNVEIAQRLFVTRKTVEKHLGNAYSKLEVGGRGELAGALEVEPEGLDA